MTTPKFLANMLWVLSWLCLTGCDDTNTSSPSSKAFSVSNTKKVIFSKGNLQYTQSTSTWSFAEHQYDMIGTDNITGGTVSFTINGEEKQGDTLADKIDLFGWSGSTGAAKWGISTSLNDSDYFGDFVDWGKNIGDGTTYRTLTCDEWKYLINSRTNANEKKGIARIKLNDTEYVNGLILLPDNWTCPKGVTFKNGFVSEWNIDAYAVYQTFSLAEWHKLETVGAVFLPASGNGYGTVMFNMQNLGSYWSGTANDPDSANYLYFYSKGASSTNYHRYYGQAVRLVQDVD